MKKIVALLVVLILAIPMVVNAAFSDVVEEHWAAGYINELTQKGIINGYTDGTFKPNNTLTRGEFLKLIITASIPDLDFSKVTPKYYHWAASYVTVAENYGVIEKDQILGTNIDKPISRIEVIKILSLCDINIRGARNLPNENALSFRDIDGLSEKEAALLSHAVSKGIINGYSDGTFKPNNSLTRAEATKVLSIYINEKEA